MPQQRLLQLPNGVLADIRQQGIHQAALRVVQKQALLQPLHALPFFVALVWSVGTSFVLLLKIANCVCSGADASRDPFVGFEGSMQLYTELLNHRPPSGAWQVATAGCSGLAAIFARTQVLSSLAR